MRSSIIAVSCFIGVVNAESERFPLSGIVANGVNVRVKGKLMDTDAILDFETPDRQVAFRFHPKAGAGEVERSSPVSGSAALTFGGFYPFTVGDVVTMDFLKTKSTWKVTVNDKRLPWFDYPIDPERKMTHVRIYSGLHDPEVTLTRPECDTPCSSDECSSCPAATCYATSEAACTSDTYTDDAGVDFHCCDGARDGLENAELHPSWVQFHADTDLVEAACEAFGQPCVDDGLAGKVAQVKSVDASTKGVQLFVPFKNQVYTLSSYVLQEHVVTGEIVDVDRAQVTVEDSTRLILDGPHKGKYVYMLFSTTVTPNRWMLHTTDRFSSQASWKMVLTTVPQNGNENDCVDSLRQDDSEWRARRSAIGATRQQCHHFKEKGFCTKSGKETAAFVDYYGSDQPNFSDWPDENADDPTADLACCTCGGGSYGTDAANPPLNGFALGTSLLVL